MGFKVKVYELLIIKYTLLQIIPKFKGHGTNISKNGKKWLSHLTTIGGPWYFW